VSWELSIPSSSSLEKAVRGDLLLLGGDGEFLLRDAVAPLGEGRLVSLRELREGLVLTSRGALPLLVGLLLLLARREEELLLSKAISSSVLSLFLCLIVFTSDNKPSTLEDMDRISLRMSSINIA
jgi:hypothetical protein